jgi:NAD(P)-dependent dehydrogenase (short-subunit alcohol dehydrogenase family)
MKVAVVLGVGPGLGMSIAHRFGREGYAVALVSRGAARHAGYVEALSAAGVEATALTADVRDRARLDAVLDTVASRHGGVDVVYYGPGAADPSARPTPIDRVGSDAVREAMSWVYPAVDVVERVLPSVTERGGGLLFAGGLSAVLPLPALGALALSSAALRNYALTLNATLTDRGVYAGTLTIGGLVERGDIHALVTAQRERFGDIPTLNPDLIADEAWRLYTERDRPETVFNALSHVS